MIKRDELANAGSCTNRARDDEMMFVLLARDPAAPSAIRYWCAMRIALGKNKETDAQIAEAYACANEMERQRTAK